MSRLILKQALDLLIEGRNKEARKLFAVYMENRKEEYLAEYERKKKCLG